MLRGRTRFVATRAAIGLAVALLAAGGVVLWATGLSLLPPSLTGEADRLAELLRIKPGMVVAEIGAGGGDLTVAIARKLGATGRIYSTELDGRRRDDIRRAAQRAELGNVMVVEAGERETNLPPGCCEAIFMRQVYHHIGDPASFNRSVRASLKSGGLFAVIDFERMWGLPRIENAPAGRNGHGTPREALVKEVTAAGFVHEQTIDDWSGQLYLVLFRAP